MRCRRHGRGRVAPALTAGRRRHGAGARLVQVKLLTRDKSLVSASVVRRDDDAAALLDRRVLVHIDGTTQRFDGAPAAAVA